MSKFPTTVQSACESIGDTCVLAHWNLLMACWRATDSASHVMCQFQAWAAWPALRKGGNLLPSEKHARQPRQTCVFWNVGGQCLEGTNELLDEARSALPSFPSYELSVRAALQAGRLPVEWVFADHS
eukprot:1276995-Amphidinium_carterae.1